MIQANEIRLGNHILDSVNNDIITVSFNTFLYISNGRTAFNPIQLTKDILSKTNLTKPKGCEYYVLGSHSIDDRLPTYRLAYLDGKCHISVGTNQHGIMLIILDKLHELQNFHYAVIGEELQVNL